MATHVFQKGEKVFIDRPGGWAYTITLVSGDSAVLDDDQIIKLDRLHPVVFKMSNGWYKINTLPGCVYYIEWATNERPTFLWGLNLSTQKIEAVPKPLGSTLVYSAFNALDFEPVQLYSKSL